MDIMVILHALRLLINLLGYTCAVRNIGKRLPDVAVNRSMLRTNASIMAKVVEEAAKVKSRAQRQITSLVQNRRTLEHLVHTHNDDTTHGYMCFIRVEKHLHIGGWGRYGEPPKYTGGIEYQKVKQAVRVIEDNEDKWSENFDFDV